MAQENSTEQIVRAYFEASGRSVIKLPAKEGAADFRVCYDDNCFLCEVKMIESAHANYSSIPLDFHLEQRKQRRDERSKWQEESPGKQLILRKEDYEYIYGDEVEFTKKYERRRRNTEDWFNKFAKKMKDYFGKSSVSNLPYNIRLDSDDLYWPSKEEEGKFFEWLEAELKAISEGRVSRSWVVDKPSYRPYTFLYSTSYPIHQPTHENDTKSEYQIMIEGPFRIEGLEVNLHSYGTLNLAAITQEVKKAVKQLEKSATRESDKQIPCIIVLAFASGIGHPKEYKLLSSHINSLLEGEPNLSAIAVLDWVLDGTPPPKEAGIEAWLQFHSTTPIVPRFIVYHNPGLQGVKHLPLEVFKDKRSVQLNPPLSAQNFST